jgi:L,D-peptidoglycan transpeptidase YkuD (ErfK/YbiS/YcfS/YnhG family)
MAWCDDKKNSKKYNKLIKINKNINHEKLYRKDYKYDLLIPIKYNFKKRVVGKGSCIFIHLTNDYKPTAGCIALKKKDFLIMIKIINKNSKIKIN